MGATAGGAITRRLQAAIAVVAALVLVLVVASASKVGAWLGTACGYALLAAFLHGARNDERFAGARRWLSRHADRIPEVLCLVFLLAFYAETLGPSTLGTRPVDHDHPVHYAKAWQMHQLLLDGHVRGWSDMWFAGYPANYLYPPGGDLFVNAVHGLGLGLMSFSSAYGLAIFLLMVLSGYSMYRVGRVYVGPWVGFAAAVMFALDPGSFRYGGWTNTVLWGVWPQQLGVMFVCFGLAEIPAVLRRGPWAPVGRCGMFLGFSLLAHPASLLMLGMVVPPMFLGVWASEDRKHATLRLAAAGGLGLMIAALYMVPFMDTKSFAMKRGRQWRDAAQMASSVYQGDLMKGSGWFTHGLAALGAVWLLRKHDWKAWYLVVSGAAVLALGTTTFLETMGPIGEEVSRNVNLQRVSILVKPFFLFAAAAAIVAFARATIAEREWTTRPRYLHLIAIAAVGFFVAPMTRPFTKAVRKAHDWSLIPVEKRKYRKSIRKLLAFAETLPNEPLTRWLFDHKKAHLLIDLATEIGSPVYKYRSTPCSIYKYKIHDHSEKAIKAANIRYVLRYPDAKKKKKKNKKAAKARTKKSRSDSKLVEIAKFGELQVLENTAWSPLPFDVIKGKGDVELVSYAPEEIVLRASPGARGRLRLHVPHFPRWHVRVDGTPLEIEAKPIRGVQFSGFMTVPLQPGEYRITFERTSLDLMASALGIGGLLLCLGLMGAGPFRRGRERWRSRADAAQS